MRTHLDLFSGIGGFSIAAQWAGFETVAFVECDPFAQKVLRKNWPDIPQFQDVRKFYRMADDMEPCPDCCDEPFCSLCGTHFWECACTGCSEWDDEFGYVDLITGGVPCQPASVIGERRGADDDRWLWDETIRIIGRLRPRFALLENPTGLFSVDGGRGFAGILAGIHEIGFDASWETVPACAVGARHRRDRIWLTLADTGCTGLERHAWNEHGTKRRKGTPDRPAPARSVPSRPSQEGGWKSDAGICRVAHGIPDRMDRLRCIGNAIVPHVAFQILKNLPE